MASLRIEFTQRYLLERDRELYEDTMNIPVPEQCYKYRRIYPCLCDIDYPQEIPDDAAHCEVVFKNNEILVVKGSYSDIALQIDDREQQEYGDL